MLLKCACEQETTDDNNWSFVPLKYSRHSYTDMQPRLLVPIGSDI